MRGLPAGTVTFLMTDVEGSTAAWESGGDAMRAAVAAYDRIVDEAVAAHEGALLKARGEGDSHFAVFARATDAARAAIALQQELTARSALSVRVALHAGEAELRDADYYGVAVNRCARLRAIGHGGQVLLSEAVAALVRGDLPEGASLVGLGAHRLKDLVRPEQVSQLSAAGLAGGFPALRSLDARPHNLPIQATSFVGRESDLAELTAMVADRRLLTLSGSGGAGKTRLALQVAADAIDDFEDGAWLIELAAVDDPAAVAARFVSVLGVPSEEGRSEVDGVVAFLRHRQALLILDNCEHLVGACAVLVDAILRACLEIRVITTSRQALSVGGEVVWAIPSLTVPSLDPVPPLDALTQYEAVRLFLNRAVAARADFTVTNANAAALAEICHRLDGIPLALELAASLVRVLALDELAARLGDRFRLLTGGLRTALPRHQTLRAAVDWSHDLLDDSERVVFRRFAVFAGGAPLEGVEQVCAEQGVDVLDAVTSLLDKSMLVAEDTDGAMRYRMLETIREYAAERLDAARETDGTRDRQMQWVKGSTLDGADLDNARVALDWAEEAHPDELAPMVADLGEWLGDGGGPRELSGRVQAALRDPARLEPAVHARLVFLWAGTAWSLFDWHEAQRLGGQALSLARAVGDDRQLWKALNTAGAAAWRAGDLEGARPILSEAAELARRHGWLLELALGLSNLSLVELSAGRLDEAERLRHEALGVQRSADASNPWVLGGLAEIAQLRGNYGAAEAYLDELLNGDEPWRALSGLAGIAGRQHDFDRAVGLYRRAVDARSAEEWGQGPGYDDMRARLAEALFRARALDDARARRDEVVADLKKQGKDRQRAVVLAGCGFAAARADLGDDARPMLEEASALAAALDQVDAKVVSLRGLAELARQEAEPSTASQHLSAALRVQPKELHAVRMATLLAELASAEAAREEWESAARAMGAADGLFTPPGLPTGIKPEGYDEAVAATRATLGDERFEELLAEGRADPYGVAT